MTAPRVAVITPNPTPYRAPFFRALAASGAVELKVFFLTRGSATRPWQVDLTGIDHEFLPEWSIPIGGKDSARYRINPAVMSRLRSGRFDAVVVAGYNHFTTQAAILYSVATGTPWCMMSESHIAKPRGAARRAVKQALLGPLLRTMSAAMVTGTLARRYVESFGVPPEAVFVVANTPDVAWFRSESARLAPGRAEIRSKLGVADRRVILFVGRLMEEKGLRVLFEAYGAMKREAPDAALLVAGDGRRRAEYEALAAERPLEGVQFLGFKAQADLPALYAAADVFVLPSLVEPWGVVVNEAMASGLPVVVSDQVGASADLVEEGRNGHVVPAGDAAALARALGDVLGDEARRSEMGEESVRIVSRWDYAASIEGFCGAVARAVERKGRAR